MADETTNWGMGNPFLGQNNPYLQANIDAASQDMVQNYNLSAIPASNAAMLRSGSFGNSGLQELQNQQASTLQKNLGNLSNTARFNDYNQQQQEYNWQKQFGEGQRQYDQNFDRGVWNDAFSQNQQNLQTGIGLLGTLNGYNQGDVANSTNQQNTPLNYWQQFQNASNGIANGFGSQTQGTTSNPLASALGGAQLGASAWGKWQGTSGNSYTGSNDFAGTNGSNSMNNFLTYGSGGD